MNHSHQSGSLKQKNKNHKGSKSSKREAKRGFGAGQVSSAAKRGKSNAADMMAESRMKRQHAKQQQQRHKRDEKWLEKRLGTSLGPPKTIGIVPISASSNAPSLLYSCLEEASWTSQPDLKRGDPVPSIVHAQFKGQRMRCTFITAANRELTTGAAPHHPMTHAFARSLIHSLIPFALRALSHSHTSPISSLSHRQCWTWRRW